MKKHIITTTTLISTLILLLSSCGDGKNVPMRTDTTSSGVAKLVVDECLAPIIQEQVIVFEGTYPEATLLPIYTSDNEAYKMFLEDSVRLIVGTRELTESENNILKARKQKLRTKRLAVDGIALIVNKENMDTLIHLDQIQKIMTGDITSWSQLNDLSTLGDIQVVFDRPNSSTARFISDSITNKKAFAPNVKAVAEDSLTYSTLDATPNQQVIDYVAKNKNALGVVGVNWISDPRDASGLTFSSKVNVMSINNPRVDDGKSFYKPYAGFLGIRYYPLSRDVYMMISDMQGGLPSGFVTFAIGEKGQRMINKSGLFPATVPTRLVRFKPMSEL